LTMDLGPLSPFLIIPWPQLLHTITHFILLMKGLYVKACFQRWHYWEVLWTLEKWGLVGGPLVTGRVSLKGIIGFKSVLYPSLCFLTGDVNTSSYMCSYCDVSPLSEA
jgi:hypothetical protein